MKEFFYLAVFEWTRPVIVRSTCTGVVSINPDIPTDQVFTALVAKIREDKSTTTPIPDDAIVLNFQLLPRHLVGNVE